MSIDRQRRILLVLFALFLAPVVLAILMHSKWWDFQPQETRNHGELVEPAIELPQPLAAILRQPTAAKKWSLLLTAPQGCNNDCRQRLDWLNQVRLAQAQHRDAVRIVLAAGDPVSADSTAVLRRLAPGLVIIDGERGSNLLALAPAAKTAATYIIDPEGFIILQYPASMDPTGIRKDLDRLLTWSQRREPDSPES